MKCPFCHEIENRVIDSRLSKDSNMVRRRRECERCTRRFTTYERVEEMMPLVVKKDGRREGYDRVKIINGLKRACEKRPVSINTIEAIADRIERTLQERGEKEIISSVIGEALMRELHDTDPVAYVRFASVYRSFKDIGEFMVELEELIKERKSGPHSQTRRLTSEKGIALAGARGSEQEQRYLRQACRLARRAAGRTSPNPMVGAVLVRGGKVVGAGYHHFAGGDHAEINALKQAGAKAKGATLYITLEPCSHQGRTPPCTRALIAAGVRQVVAGMQGPQSFGRRARLPAIAPCRYQSVAKVRAKMNAAELIEAFAKFITKRLPFVTVKLAATLDGKIASASGDARWISSEHSRARVHRWRNEMDAVLVGAGTVRADDPLLTCRIAGGRNPYRVVLDSRLADFANGAAVAFARRRQNHHRDYEAGASEKSAGAGKVGRCRLALAEPQRSGRVAAAVAQTRRHRRCYRIDRGRRRGGGVGASRTRSSTNWSCSMRRKSSAAMAAR